MNLFDHDNFQFGAPEWFKFVVAALGMVTLLWFVLDVDDSKAVTRPSSPPVYYQVCADAPRPLHYGQPGYRLELDRDGDGVACEWSGRTK